MTATKTKVDYADPARVLEGLQAAREHINSKWKRGVWFGWQDEKTGKLVTSDDETMPPDTNVTAVCAAGSILYALDYTDEQWTTKDDVKPVMEALFDAIPDSTTAKKRYVDSYGDNSGWSEAAIYDHKVDTIVHWNDTRGRSKEQVLATFDRAIENVTKRLTLDIQELP